MSSTELFEFSIESSDVPLMEKTKNEKLKKTSNLNYNIDNYDFSSFNLDLIYEKDPNMPAFQIINDNNRQDYISKFMKIRKQKLFHTKDQNGNIHLYRNEEAHIDDYKIFGLSSSLFLQLLTVRKYYYKKKKFTIRNFTVKVENLPRNTKYNNIKHFFSKFGEIYKIEIIDKYSLKRKLQKEIFQLELKLYENKKLLENNLKEKYNTKKIIKKIKQKKIQKILKYQDKDTEDLYLENALVMYKTHKGAHDCLKTMKYGISRRIKSLLFGKCFNRYKRPTFNGKKIKVSRPTSARKLRWGNFNVSTREKIRHNVYKIIVCVVITWIVGPILSYVAYGFAVIEKNEYICIPLSFLIYLSNEVLEWLLIKLRKYPRISSKLKERTSMLHIILFAKSANTIGTLIMVWFTMETWTDTVYMSLETSSLIVFIYCILDPIVFILREVYQEKRKMKFALERAQTTWDMYKNMMPKKVWLSLWYVRVLFILHLIIAMFIFIPFLSVLGLIGIGIIGISWKIFLLKYADANYLKQITEFMHKRVMYYFTSYSWFVIIIYWLAYKLVYFPDSKNVEWGNFVFTWVCYLFWRISWYGTEDFWDKKQKYTHRNYQHIRLKESYYHYKNPSKLNYDLEITSSESSIHSEDLNVSFSEK
ncbi:putative transmembrane protein [Anaeramoeba flamelloides]|uniref:Transmembrane protein n=1 Tax=Anaeramoeba flamelloides TaxID=1746091 RepID=A0AAV8A1S9_9EUKA|nr:putative transmembrane protein [Anaeramoeba flamelloides]